MTTISFDFDIDQEVFVVILDHKTSFIGCHVCKGEGTIPTIVDGVTYKVRCPKCGGTEVLPQHTTKKEVIRCRVTGYEVNGEKIKYLLGSRHTQLKKFNKEDIFPTEELAKESM
jgi:DnaJ-class molecular chaperone